MGFAPEFSLGRPGRLGEVMNNGVDYNYKRGAWVHKHPPPTSLKFADCRGGFLKYHPPPTAKTIGESRFPLRSWTQFHPPPSKNTWANKTIYEKHRFRNRQTAENAAPRSRPKTIRYCGSGWPFKYSCWPH